MSRPTNRLPPPTEKQVQGYIVGVLRKLGAKVYSTSQARPSKISVGLPDLLIFHRDRFAFIEVKREGGKMSTAQVVFEKLCVLAGIEHHVWTSPREAAEWVTAINKSLRSQRDG